MIFTFYTEDCKLQVKGQLQVPEAEFLEWSLPGPLRGSDIEIFIWLVLIHFNDEIDLMSHLHRSFSKLQLIYPPVEPSRKLNIG